MSIIANMRMIIDALVKPEQYISIEETPKGRVIDIGGGGEGIIAQAGGSRIFAVDKFMSEILEAKDKASSSHWLVANAGKLPYSSASFANATAFFSCMYMSEEMKKQVFRETHRALKPGGEFWIWDANIAPKQKAYGIRLHVAFPVQRSTKTMYGTRIKNQSSAAICAQLQEAGFETEVVSNQRHWFFIRAKIM
jgi:ubiquinone/menaquinone biosynthesis C-methylase UbiE